MAEDILGKIKKLLALATSSNVNEAAAAAAKVQELMMKHRINVADVAAEDSAGVHEPILNEEVMFTRSVILWRQCLIKGLADANGCEVYVNRREDGAHYRVIGPTSEIQVVSYMYAYLSREVDRLASLRSAMGRRWLRDFRLGAVLAIVKRVELANESVKSAYAGSTALVRINDDLQRVKDAYDGLNLAKARPVNGIRNEAAFMSGKKAGDTVIISNKATLDAGSAGDLTE